MSPLFRWSPLILTIQVQAQHLIQRKLKLLKIRFAEFLRGMIMSGDMRIDYLICVNLFVIK